MQRPQVSGAGGWGTGTVRCRTEPLFVMHLLNERSWPALFILRAGPSRILIARSDRQSVLPQWIRLHGLLLGVIAEHMCQHLGVEDAARR